MKNLVVIAFICFGFTSGFAKDSKRLLILGDSITEGYGVSKSDAFPSQLQKLIEKEKKDVTVVSAGISGSTSASALKRLQWQMKSKPDILILALGANDGLRGIDPKVTKKNLDEAIKLAKSEDVEIYLAGMKLPLNYGATYRTAFEKVFTDLVKENKIKSIPFLLEGVGGQEKLNLADGIHPNEQGHKIIADYVLSVIKESL